MRGWRRCLISGMTDLLYPRRCPVCHGLTPRGRMICPECLGRLPVIEGRRCAKCGKPAAARQVLCDDCVSTKHLFAQGAGVFLYDDVMRETVSCFKYRGRREYGPVLGSLMLQSTRGLIAAWKPDIIMPVPLHPKRLAGRGFNQAELLAEPLARGCGIPLESGILYRRTDTAAQKTLGRQERRRNLEGAFACRDVPLPERILLVDDIYTTGSTVDACAAVLLAKGASRIFFLTLCTGGALLS